MSLSKLFYGGDYNPEQWPSSIWEEDMRLFKLANINSASINIFSWAKLQPNETTYDFSELDEIVKLLKENNINMVMATSTAALPAWMTREFPDVNRVDFEGRQHRFSHRHNHCPNSPSFKRFASELVKRIAERYGKEEHLILWHVSNEYNGECYCENCERAFRKWVENKYKTIEQVNEAWNFHFWGHTLHSFEDIVVPNFLGDGVNDRQTAFAGISVDYRRFMSESLLNNFKMERDIIRAMGSNAPITTNLMGSFKGINAFEWAKEMDIISWDNYPHYIPDWAFVSFNHDLMRGVKSGKNFLIMEQSPSQQNWQPYNLLKRPGELHSQSFHAIAHGAEAINYFQLRQSIGGNEKWHGAVIGHEGHENTRVFKEVTQIGEDLKRIGDELLDATTHAKVAILFDWESYWALEYSSGPNKDIYYVDQVFKYYKELYKRNIAVDIIGYEEDLSKYKLILAPFMYMVKGDIVDKLEQFVSDGGHFVTTTMSGLVDGNDNVLLGGYPGALKDLLGIWVEEFDGIAPEMSNKIYWDNNQRLKNAAATMICDIIHLNNAKSLAYYSEDFYADCPVFVYNNFGKGKTWYVGTVPNNEFLEEIVTCILEELTIEQFDFVPSSIEIVRREKEDFSLIFIMNHSSNKVEFDWDFSGVDILSGNQIDNYISIAPYGTIILKISE